MAKPDWLSIEEITRLWSAETGHDAAAFREDLEAWFTEFVKQPPKPDSLVSSGGTDNTNRLMGLLGARHLNRATFETYCEERGHPMPRFWSGSRSEPRPVEKAAGPAPIDPAAGRRQSPSADAPPPEAAESDPDLAAFQKHIESLSERLQTGPIKLPSADVASSETRPPKSQSPKARFPDTPPSETLPSGTRPDLEAHPGKSEPRGISDRQELIEQAAAAAAEARDLKAQLEAAEQRIRDLSSEKDGARPATSSSGRREGAAETQANRRETDAGSPPGRQAFVGYRGPDAAGQILRQRSRRRTGRARVLLAVGLAVPVIALLLWGAETMFDLAHKQPLSPGLEPVDPVAASGPQGDGPGQVAPDLEQRVAQIQTDTAEPAPDQQVGQDRSADRREIARLNAALETSGLVVARLQAELALARQQAESARRAAEAGPGAASDALDERERRDLMLVATEASARADALQRSFEENRRQTAELTKALAAVKAEGIEMTAALRQAETRAAQAEETARAAQAEAEKAEAAAAALEETKTDVAVARDDAARLRESLQEVEDQAQAQRQDAALATMVSTARVAALQRELVAAREALTEGTLASEEMAADLSRLGSALEQAEERAAEAEDRTAKAETAQETAEAAADEARAALAKAQQRAAALAERVDESIELATNIDKSLAGARAETNRLRRDNARLADELAAATSEVSRLDAALQLAQGRVAAGRQDLSLATTASSVRVADLERELEAARQQITRLSEAVGSARDEATRLRNELSARQQEAAATTPGPGASPPNAPAGPEVEPGPGPQGAADVGAAKIEELLASAESSPEPGAAPAGAEAGPQAPAPEAASASGKLDQISAVGPTPVISEAHFPGNTVAADELLLEPGDHVGQEVVVTGSVVWLLWRYRLQSESGPGSLVIDVDGLQSTDQTVLKKAMEEVGLLGQVRARIKGIIERRGDATYHLAASEVVLVE